MLSLKLLAWVEVKTSMNNNQRITALKESLKEDSMDIPKPLSDLFKARLSDLSLEDAHYQKGIRASLNTDSIINDVYDEVFTAKVVGNYDEARLISNLALTSLIDLNEFKPTSFGKQNFAMSEAEPIVNIMSESEYGYLGALALSRQEQSFSKSTVEQLGELPDYLKDPSIDIGYDKLLQSFMISKGRLDKEIKLSDASSLSNTLANLTAYVTHESILNLMENNPDISYLMYNSAGRQVSTRVLDTALNEKNANYAMSLLMNRDSGILSKGDVFASSDKKVKQLLSIIAQDEKALDKLTQITNSSKTQVQKTVVMESIIDAHNELYLPEQLEKLIEDNIGSLSHTQLEQIGYKLLKNSNRQPVGKALNKLFEIASASDMDVSQLRKVKAEQDLEFKERVKSLNKPLSAYSSVTLNDTKTSKALAVRDALTPTHLEHIIEDMFDVNVSEMRIIGSKSLLDEKVKTSVMNYLETGDKEALAEVMSKPLMDTYKGDVDLPRLLHEASYQDAQLPARPYDTKYLIVSDAVEDSCYIRNNGDPVVRLANIRTAEDLREALVGIDVVDISVDETKLGKAFDVELNQSIKSFSNSPHSKATEDALNKIVGLPLDFSSSKIDENQVKFKKTQQSNNVVSGNSPELLTNSEDRAVDTGINTGLPRSPK